MRYGYRLRKGEASKLFVLKKGRGLRNCRGGGKLEIMTRFGLVESSHDSGFYTIETVTRNIERVESFKKLYTDVQCIEIEPGKYKLIGKSNI